MFGGGAPSARRMVDRAAWVICFSQSDALSQIWVLTRHQCGISALVSQTPFYRETRSGIAKCWLFSQARPVTKRQIEQRSYV